MRRIRHRPSLEVIEKLGGTFLPLVEAPETVEAAQRISFLLLLPPLPIERRGSWCWFEQRVEGNLGAIMGPL